IKKSNEHVGGYTVADFYSRNTLNVGELMILVRQDVDFKKLDLEYINIIYLLMERAAIRLYYNNEKVNVFGLYRSPGTEPGMFFGSPESELYTFMDYSLAADYNVDKLDAGHRRSKDYKGCFEDHTMIQGDSQSLINNIFTNIGLHNVYSTTLDNNISDHHAQIKSSINTFIKIDYLPHVSMSKREHQLFYLLDFKRALRGYMLAIWCQGYVHHILWNILEHI
ncbi:hypothetical protein HHI36_002646, partial [Cryptolaemus montrouzieri]